MPLLKIRVNGKMMQVMGTLTVEQPTRHLLVPVVIKADFKCRSCGITHAWSAEGFSNVTIKDEWDDVIRDTYEVQICAHCGAPFSPPEQLEPFGVVGPRTCMLRLPGVFLPRSVGRVEVEFGELQTDLSGEWLVAENTGEELVLIRT